MDKKILYAIVYLGICMMVSAGFISNAIHTNNQPEKPLLTKEELGEYLGLDDEALNKIVPDINTEVMSMDNPKIASFRINNQFYFSKIAVDHWLVTGERSFYENYDFDFFNPMSNK
ncbi:hypothetical protein VQL36_15425 [Chengkuizengella sp. SCS-71B]|uniref:hypothetical protein n=1 Tax=Chengkuizengella sp. SCS-71B TaxID=3115290 RepID=UPI0032C22D51